MRASVPATADPVKSVWTISAAGALSIALAVVCACRTMMPALSFYGWCASLTMAGGALNLWFWHINRPTYQFALRSLVTGIAAVALAFGLIAMPRTALDASFVYALGTTVVATAGLSMWEIIRLSAESPEMTRRIACLMLCAMALSMAFVAGPLCGERPMWACAALALGCVGLARMFLSCKFRLANSQIC